MKCTQCGSRLEGPMTFCPACGVRPDIDLRQLHFREVGTSPHFTCPECSTHLNVLEINTEPPLSIERCAGCHGLFFNPGELETTLESQAHSIAWLDKAQISQINADFEGPRSVVYRPCPVCRERMGHSNFGGRSGVIVDRCATHGIWLQGSQLRRLSEWWRAGGKHLHQQHELERARRLHAPTGGARRPKVTGSVESIPVPDPAWTWALDPVSLILDVLLSSATSN
ncbi:MAG: zf-TFIIB domain-containing protein [Verrucomicrobiales bacterium]